jgi:hypothetical protein
VQSSLFMAHQDVLDLILIEQGIVNMQNGSARVAKYVFDSLFLQTADSNFRSGQLHHKHLKYKQNRTAYDNRWQRFGQLYDASTTSITAF